jgi:hypothetical protein
MRHAFPEVRTRQDSSPVSQSGADSGFITRSCVTRNCDGDTAAIFSVVAFWMNSRVGQPFCACHRM